MRLLTAILFFFTLSLSAQEVYKGWLPYYPGRDGDTTIGVYIQNSGDGYSGFYGIRETDTFRLHWDKAGEVVLNYLDSLYLQTFNLYYLNYSASLDTIFINSDTLKLGEDNYWRWGENAQDMLAPIVDAEILFFDGVQVLTDYWTLSETNTFLGMGIIGAGNLTDDADNNTAYGYKSLYNLTKGDGNVAIGGRTLEDDTTGNYNTAVGYAALYKNLSAHYNTAIGYEALYSTTTGGNNTAVGYDAGRANVTGTGNVFIGYRAGEDELGSDKLYIENTDGADPLIWGDFLNDTVRINGALEVEDMPTAAKAYFVVADAQGATLGLMDTTDWRGGGDTCLWYYVADDTIKTWHNVWVDSSLNMKYTTNLDTYYFLNGDESFGLGYPNMGWGFNDPYNSDSSGAVMIQHNDGYRINITSNSLTHESSVTVSNDGVSMWGYLPTCNNKIDMTTDGIDIESDSVITLAADSIFAQTIPEETKQFLLMIDGNTGKITKIDTADMGGMGGDSYWTKNVNHLYPDNTTDSVAIGGTTALAPFTLTGHMSFTGEGVIRTPDNEDVPIASAPHIYIYGGDGDPDGGVFLNIDEADAIHGEVFIGKVAEETASDSILTLDERGAIGWTSRAGILGGYWDEADDTLTADYHVKIDSTFTIGRFNLIILGTAPDDTLAVVHNGDTIRLIPPR